MKRFCRISAAMLAALLCCGCSWMDGSYVSVTSHQVGYLRTDDEPFVVSSYPQLRSALMGLVDSGAERALITLVNYPEDELASDMENAIGYVSAIYPIGAYAVDTISYEQSVSGQDALSVTVSYRRSRSDIDQIRNVRGIKGAEDAIAGALRECQRALVLQITGYEEADFVQLAEDYSLLHPDIVMEPPFVTSRIYPEQGPVRILEMQFSYRSSRDQLRSMRAEVEPVFSSAQLYVSPEAEDEVKLSQLYNFLMQRADYTFQFQTSITPAYSLLCYGVGDSRAFADVYGAMCRQVGLEAITVSGTCRGESRFWNIVRCGDSFYHIDLLRSYASEGFRLYSDSQMSDYVWDYSAYPVCGTTPQIPPETLPQLPLNGNTQTASEPSTEPSEP